MSQANDRDQSKSADTYTTNGSPGRDGQDKPRDYRQSCTRPHIFKLINRTAQQIALCVDGDSTCK